MAPTPKKHHIARGTMYLAMEPTSIRTIVGSGYAVAICLADGQTGGLVHLERRAGALPPVQEHNALCHPPSRLAELLERLGNLGSLAGAAAEIIGGARLLTPTHPAVERDAFVDAVSGCLKRHAIWVRRTQVGGASTLLVSLELPGGAVNVSETRTLASVVPAAWPPPVDEPSRRVSVNIGCMSVERSPARLTTLLGSCVGVALRDDSTKIGGLAHIVLPRSPDHTSDPAKYADTAVAALVHALVKAGANRRSLRAKIAGGATIIAASQPGSVLKVAAENVTHTRAALAEAEIPIVEADVGGHYGRRMTVDLSTFDMEISLLRAGRGG